MGQSYLHIDSIAKWFIQMYFNLDVHELASRFEAFAISGLSGVAGNDNDHRVLLKHYIQNMVRAGLREYMVVHAVLLVVLISVNRGNNRLTNN